MTTKTTAELITEYNERITNRFRNCQLGSSRDGTRQAKINAIVDELFARGDAGDAEALEWSETR